MGITKFILFLSTALMVSCNTCDSNAIYGKVSGNKIKGTFTVKALAQEINAGHAELHVSLEKSSINAKTSGDLLMNLEDVQNWNARINGHPLDFSIAFVELSNSMTPNINIVLPISADSASWFLEPTTSFEVSFDHPISGFNSLVDAQSIKCHCEYLESINSEKAK